MAQHAWRWQRRARLPKIAPSEHAQAARSGSRCTAGPSGTVVHGTPWVSSANVLSNVLVLCPLLLFYTCRADRESSRAPKDTLYRCGLEIVRAMI